MKSTSTPCAVWICTGLLAVFSFRGQAQSLLPSNIITATRYKNACFQQLAAPRRPGTPLVVTLLFPKVIHVFPTTTHGVSCSKLSLWVLGSTARVLQISLSLEARYRALYEGNLSSVSRGNISNDMQRRFVSRSSRAPFLSFFDHLYPPVDLSLT